MSTNVPVADIKAATLKMQLHADSGYEASAEYRISADQWSRILSVAEDGEKGRVMAASAEPLEELQEMVSLVEMVIPFDGPQQRKARAAIAKATGEPQ